MARLCVGEAERGPAAGCWKYQGKKLAQDEGAFTRFTRVV